METHLSTAKYDRVTIALHWLIALLVAGQWLGAHVIDWFPWGPLRVDARSLHIVGGVLVGGLMLVRLGWRVTSGRHLPPEGPALADLAARGVKAGLYLLVFAIVAIGVALALTRGDNLFGLIQLPGLGADTREARHALSEQIVEYHELAANLILAVAGFHAAAALVHHFWFKDGVLRRMALR